MKKFSSTSILGLTLAVVLASPYLVHAQAIDPTVTDPAPEVADTDPMPLPPPDRRGDRFDPRGEHNVSYTWSRDVERIVRSGAATGSQPVRKEVNLVSSETRNYTSYDPVTVQVPIRRCAETAANGGSSNWNGFFNVSQAQKPQALAATIKGVGQARAEQLVAHRAFDHKPRSWGEFEQIIDREDDYIPGLYHDVITRFGAENRQALGYGYVSQEDCVIVGYRPRTTYVEQSHSALTGRVNRLTFALEIEGGALLPAESDTFTVYYEQNRVWVEEPNYYNRYSIETTDRSTRDGYAEKIAHGTRNRVKPPVALSVTALANNGRLDLVVTDNNYANVPGLGERYALYQPMQSKSFRDNELGAQGSATLKPDTASTKVETQAAPNMRQGAAAVGGDRNRVKAYAKVRIKYKNSIYYTEEPSAEAESSKADFGPKQR